MSEMTSAFGRGRPGGALRLVAAPAVAGAALLMIWFGFFLGLMMSVWSTSSAAFGDYLLIGLMMGAAFGIITGVIRYALIRRQQSYTSVTQVVATTYVLVCPPEVSGEAMRILGTSSEV